MSINPKDFNWIDQYNQGGQIGRLINKNSNHIWDYMLTRPKYTNPLFQMYAFHKYSPRTDFGKDDIVNLAVGGIYNHAKFDNIGIDNFSNKKNEQHQAVVNSAMRLADR